MNKNLLIGLFVLVLLVVGGYYLSSQNGTDNVDQTVTDTVNMTEDDSMAEEDSMDGQSNMMMSVDLSEQNDSGETGTATLVEQDGQIVVTLNMQGSPEDTEQPAHIHTGECPDVGGVVYPLTNVLNGESETTIDATFEDLTDQAPLAINVHQSVPQASVYTSCGDLDL